MIYTIYALEDTVAQLCVSTTRTDSKDVLALTKAHYEEQGFLVNVETEE